MKGVELSHFGLYKDVSDMQWSAYSSNIVSMVICMFVYLFLSNYIKNQTWVQKLNLQPYLIFSIVFGFFYVSYLFRSGMMFWMLFSSLNFFYIQVCYKLKYFQIIFWVIQIFSLFFINLYLADLNYKNLFLFSPSIGSFCEQFS